MNLLTKENKFLRRANNVRLYIKRISSSSTKLGKERKLSLIHPPVNQSVATFLFLKIRRSGLGKPLTVYTGVAVSSQILTITLQFLETTRTPHIVLQQMFPR